MTTANYLYVHIPFCKTICYYCDFVHRVYHEDIADAYLVSLQKEIESKQISRLKTIYIGGGTPTSLNERQLDILLSLFDAYVSEVEEYTIEINPETLTEEKIQILKKHGVNRVSIGLQTTEDRLLKLLNRHHTFSNVQSVVSLLRQYGINNISLDIMYSLPFQTMESLKKSVNDALSLHPTHLSLYSLTIEENTVFERKGYDHLDEDTEADMYEWIVQKLNDSCYHQYEVSNFALEGYESQHNQAYWRYEDFYGCGAGASGKENHIRYEKSKDIRQYIQDPFQQEEIILDQNDEMFENIMMSLRMKQGMDIHTFDERFQTSFIDVYGEKIKPLIQRGLVEIVNGYFRCSEQGFEIMNSILVELM